MRRLTSNVLIDHWSRNRSLAADLAWVAGFSLFTAAMAQIRIPLPFTPVPLTGQTFAVLLSGAVLGSRRGFASQALYLAEGAAGLPVFAGGASSVLHLLGLDPVRLEVTGRRRLDLDRGKPILEIVT